MTDVYQVNNRHIVERSVLEHDRRTLIQLPRAEDPDLEANGSVTYIFPKQLNGTPLYQKFAIKNNPGDNPQIRVVVNLDKEVDPGPFRLIVTARDRGQPPGKPT